MNSSKVYVIYKGNTTRHSKMRVRVRQEMFTKYGGQLSLDEKDTGTKPRTPKRDCRKVRMGETFCQINKTVGNNNPYE